ncbi:hypothetical protein [Alistipes onderdonkii]|uniref:hypothetical protein n=1 Tax=Alistipes onderdonkii TaxID=328813 RepID=UPI001FBB1FD6|nr:hypothetical protein [Alistipes onderdonkii]
MNKLTMKMRLLAAFLLLGLWGATAQTAREQIAAMPERAGGIYHSYEYLPGPAVPAPKGYVPFYISHYGRHGSRWHTSEKIYAEPLGILRKADSAGVLTPKGRDLLAKVEVIAADARDRYGDLSPRGVADGASPNACIRPIPRSFRPGTAANALSRAVRRSCRAAS